MIIGLCGRIGAGKDVVADFLVNNYGFKKIVMSDIIKEEMKKEGIEPTRENLQNFSKSMKEKFGKGIWAHKTLKWVKKNAIKNAVISGVRDTEEVKEFRKDPDFVLIEVYAPTTLRYKRLINRGEKKDPKTIEEAKTQDEREEKIFDLIGKCNDVADVIVNNDFENLMEFYTILKSLFDKIITT